MKKSRPKLNYNSDCEDCRREKRLQSIRKAGRTTRGHSNFRVEREVLISLGRIAETYSTPFLELCVIPSPGSCSTPHFTIWEWNGHWHSRG